ncbi:MAG: ATP-binding cassette domain-containing protein [Candidatus Aminicenantes bacterium]|nr:ATP-binding cassette domain-containing protein [Candidatus Aminicenantes bacterium]
MEAIRVEDLTKHFEGIVAVNQIRFEVKQGELFGLLGPNGAGKTTTINLLATLLKPTSGRAWVAGYDILTERNQVRRSIGIVFQDPALDVKLTGRENLEFHAMMYGYSKAERQIKIKEVLKLVDLEDKADLLVEKYSGGMKRRLEIARGLIHEPKVLFLDEPTLGLDAQTRRKIWEYIKKLNQEKKVTIILTTHYLEEADYLCQKVAIMDRGVIIAMDEPQKLKDMLGGDILSFELENNYYSGRWQEKLKNLPWVKSFSWENNSFSLTTELGERRIPEIMEMARQEGLAIKSVHLHKPSLEDVYLYFTGRKIRDEDGILETRNQRAKRLSWRR